MNVSFREHSIYAFGPFRLDPLRHTLLCNGKPISLSPRLFDTLLHLVQHAGEVVDREDLIRAVWGTRIVDEANLKQTIFALRRALQAGAPADRLIVTAPTRGYLFAAPVRLETTAEAAAPVASSRRSFIAVAAACLAACAAGALLWPRPAPFNPPAHSVAILAFTNLSSDAGQTYFSDGISEELIGALSRIAPLRVAARTSAFSFRGKSATISDIARALNVGAVLEGSVRRAGAHIRITADLIDAGTGFSLWSQSYDRNESDTLRIQSEIAAAVAAALQVSLLGTQTAQLSAGGTDNEAAFDAYLRGMKRTQESGGAATSQAALPAFDQAIALDPNFALARAARAQALLVIGNTGGTADLAQVHQRLGDAMAEADRAIAIAPNLGVAHDIRASALLSALDFTRADTEMSLAHALAPGDVRVTMDYAITQVQFGRVPAGLRAAERATSLDPLAPATYLAYAGILATAERYDAAEAALQRARILGGGPAVDAIDRGMALDRGNYRAVLDHCREGTSWTYVFCLARAYFGLGRLPEAQAQLARLRAMLGDNGAFQYAELYAQWHQPDEAIKWLQAAYRLHDTGLALLKSDPLLAPIRGMPQYQAIERDLNFPAP